MHWCQPRVGGSLEKPLRSASGIRDGLLWVPPLHHPCGLLLAELLAGLLDHASALDDVVHEVHRQQVRALVVAARRDLASR